MVLLRTTIALVAIPTFLALPRHALVEVEPRASTTSTTSVNEATCDGRQFIYQELEAVLETPEEAMAFVLLLVGSHGGRLRDRGWNTEETLNYQNRVHKIKITLTPRSNATLVDSSGLYLQS